MKKPFGADQINWEKEVSAQLLNNGSWYLKICTIAFTNVKNKETVNSLPKKAALNLNLKTNLTRQHYLWYSKLMGFPGEKENLPIEVFSVNIENLKQDVTCPNFSSNCHQITSVENRLCIQCENMSNKYKLGDFEFDATVIVNLFKR